MFTVIKEYIAREEEVFGYMLTIVAFLIYLTMSDIEKKDVDSNSLIEAVHLHFMKKIDFNEQILLH